MIPELTTEQRHTNLRLAMEARSHRAAVLRSYADGEVTLAEVLDMARTDEAVARMPASTLIRATPGYGFAKTQKLMKRLRIAESRRLRGLGSRQRASLIEALGGAR